MKLALLGLLIGFNAQANEWSHISKKVAPAVEVTLDYKIDTLTGGPSCMKCPGGKAAGLLYVNASGNGLQEKSEVLVILTSIQYNSAANMAFVDKRSYAMTLKRQLEGHFSGSLDRSTITFAGKVIPVPAGHLPLMIYGNGFGNPQIYHQEIAVNVDGNWLPNYTVNLNTGAIQ